MSQSDVFPSSLGERTRKVLESLQPEPAEWPALTVPPADLRDALQRAADGESPDALLEELRTEAEACGE